MSTRQSVKSRISTGCAPQRILSTPYLHPQWTGWGRLGAWSFSFFSCGRRLALPLDHPRSSNNRTSRKTTWPPRPRNHKITIKIAASNSNRAQDLLPDCGGVWTVQLGFVTAAGQLSLGTATGQRRVMGNLMRKQIPTAMTGCGRS